MLDFVIYICGHGVTKDVTAMCLCDLFGTRDFNFRVQWSIPDALIGRSRSIACWNFLRYEDTNNLIFIDTDQVFTPENIKNLVQAMDDGYDVIAGAYPMGDKGLAIHPWEDIRWDGHIEEIQYVSTGFMGITRKALKQIKSKLNLPLLNKGEWCECYPFFEAKACPEEKSYLSEDWEFCNKVRQAGLKAYIHTGILVGHIKERVITARPTADYKLEIRGN